MGVTDGRMEASHKSNNFHSPSRSVSFEVAKETIESREKYLNNKVKCTRVAGGKFSLGS